MINRIDMLSEKDKLWELYLHTLSGYHGNFGANRMDGKDELESNAFNAAKRALKCWNNELKL